MNKRTVRRIFSTPRSSATRRAPPADDAAVERVLKRLSGPLPRQKMPLWRLPARAARLAIRAGLAARRGAWPAAPRSASSSASPGSTAASTAPDAPFAVASRADIGSIVFEPEPLTGARP